MAPFKPLLEARAVIIVVLMLSMTLSPWSGQRIVARSIEGSPAVQPSQVQPNKTANMGGQSSTSLRSLLNTDGTLNLNSGFSGSLDPQGWKMQTGADGKPRFVQANEAFNDAKSQPQPQPQAKQPSVAGDENWDDKFGVGTNSIINAMAISGSDVYVGGYFTAAGGVTANHIARWNSSTNTWSALGSGANGNVFAIVITGNDVYVGGSFTQVGGIAANYIARWNSSAGTWSVLGSGVGFPRKSGDEEQQDLE